VIQNQISNVEYDGARLGDYKLESAERGPVDLPFLLLTLLLLAIGVVMVLSASYARAYYDVENETGGNATYYFVRQGLFALCGVGVMFLCSRFPMSFYRRISAPVLIAALGSLALVPFIGVSAGGAKRWIDLGFTTFQPSEIAKIGVVMYFSVMICRYKNKMSTFRYGILPFAAVLLLIFGLLVLEPHISAIVIIFMIGMAMLFIGGAPIRWFLLGGAAAAGGFLVAYQFFDYVKDRISAWLNPFADASDTGWQVVQSLYSIGSGGLLGLGLGNSRQKYLYLPEEHNDFIFSIVCEELGYIGAVIILVLFALLIVRGYWLAMHARNKYSLLVGTGLTTLLAMQVILNVAVCTNTVPCTGISLPLFSYGGTALLLQMAELGIILSLSRDIPEKK
jgi:cell division protein FtsW